MALNGPVPKDNPLRPELRKHEWIDVPDVPYEGPIPVKLPKYRLVPHKDGAYEDEVLQLTRDWWATVCRMPHCVLWTEADWRFALSSALVADMAYRGVSTAATELRNREKVLGTTLDYRRALRIRHVDPESNVPESNPSTPANVISMDRRSRVNAS